MLTASIVIYHNNIDDINKVLDCALKSKIDKIFLVDQSKNDSFRMLERKTDKVIYVFNHNGGYGFGHNLAFKLASELFKSKYHVVLNPDIIFESDTIEVLLDYMEKDEGIGLLMPKVYYPNGDFQFLCKLLPTPLNIFASRFFPKKYAEKVNYNFLLKEANFDKLMDIPYLSGCFMFLRMSVVQKVRGFDERFFMHFEDVDLSRRIYAQSRVVYLPEVSIIHAHAASHKTSFKMLYIALASCIKYFNKWGWFFDSERSFINRKVISSLLD